MSTVIEQPHLTSTSADADGHKRKGRRRAKMAQLRHLGIVEAAVALAKQHGVQAATASEILGWFIEADYRTRTGVPTRNSIYVSLRRAADHHEHGITREDGGLFSFKVPH